MTPEALRKEERRLKRLDARLAEPAEHGLLFVGEMVQAILDGRKTETRRPLQPQPVIEGHFETSVTPPEPAWLWRSPRLVAGLCHTDAPSMARLAAKASLYQPGSRIWVRETFAVVGYRCKGERFVSGEGSVRYRATWTKSHGGTWRPSIHMPRWASRITLSVTSVEVRRVQDIDAADVMEEGVRIPVTTQGCPKGKVTPLVRIAPDGVLDYLPKDVPTGTWSGDDIYRAEYASLWDGLYGKESPLGWKANPWVEVIRHEIVEIRT